MLILFSILLIQISFLDSKTINNKLIGTPAVTCGPDSLTISAESDDLFEGQIFVKGYRSASKDCVNLYSLDSNSTNPTYSIPLSRISSCGMEMRRDKDQKALRISTVIVFAFHPQFVTGGDRAFAVHCLFQQKDVRVDANIDVIRDLIPIEVDGIATEIPDVELSLVPSKTVEGDGMLGDVEIGQPLMMIWKLRNESMVYGIRVLDCVAESRDGKSMPIIVNGCTQDKILVSDVSYADHYQRAMAEAVAFKFPDQKEVFFKCQVKMCLKKFEHLIVNGKSLNDLCVSTPSCSNGGAIRLRRSEAEKHDNVIVVRGSMRVREQGEEQMNFAAQVSSDEPSRLCMNPGIFAAGSLISAAIYLTTFVAIILSIYYNRKTRASFTF